MYEGLSDWFKSVIVCVCGYMSFGCDDFSFIFSCRYGGAGVSSIFSKTFVFTLIAVVIVTVTIVIPCFGIAWIVRYLTREFSGRRLVQTLFRRWCWRWRCIFTPSPIFLLAFCIIIGLERDRRMTFSRIFILLGDLTNGINHIQSWLPGYRAIEYIYLHLIS